MIETVAATGSTNADLARRLAGGEPLGEGFWLVADRQLAGRGRQGRAWEDGLGNFMGSTLVRRGPADPPPASLSLAAGVAVQAALAPLLPPLAQPQLKWPNDVLVQGAKLAGILLETAGAALVVGIGVNLASAPEVAGRPTVALSRFGPAPDRDAFAARLAGCFTEELACWRQFGLAALITRWQAVAHPPGTPLVARGAGEGGADLAGHFAGLAEDGALRLALGDGTTRVIHAGDVEPG